MPLSIIALNEQFVSHHVLMHAIVNDFVTNLKYKISTCTCVGVNLDGIKLPLRCLGIFALNGQFLSCLQYAKMEIKNWTVGRPGNEAT